MDFRYESHAKVNLFLNVAARRSDGYHNIETIFQSIGLRDTLQFQSKATGIALECSSKEVGSAADNIVSAAARLLQSECECTQGVHVRLEKRIPVSAGLAGGSGNAAATLHALNTMWGLELTSERLHELALRLGSDVPFCLKGGTVAATGRGEQMRRLPDLSGVWFVLVHPQILVSTAEAYRRLSPTSAGGSLEQAIDALDNRDWGTLLYNEFESIIFDDFPQLAALKGRLMDAGCAGALMSGSGPTLFGICHSEIEARGVAGAFDGESVSISQPVTQGFTHCG